MSQNTFGEQVEANLDLWEVAGADLAADFVEADELFDEHLALVGRIHLKFEKQLLEVVGRHKSATVSVTRVAIHLDLGYVVGSP